MTVAAITRTDLSLNLMIASIPAVSVTNAATPAISIGIDTKGREEKSATSESLLVTPVYKVLADIVDVIKQATTNPNPTRAAQLSFDLNLNIVLES